MHKCSIKNPLAAKTRGISLPRLEVNLTERTTNIDTLKRVSPEGLFLPRDKYLKLNHLSARTIPDIHHKPGASTWFSHGRWLFDSFCDTSCEEHIEEPTTELDVSSTSVLFALSKQDLDLDKILIVETEEQLKAFEERFQAYFPGAEGNEICKVINWTNVQEAGYAGCIFDFNRRDNWELVLESCFLSSWDVESLVLWDWSCVKSIVPILPRIKISV